MKKKIFGILICTLLIATLAIPISAMDREYISNFKPISKGADVPTWEVNDSWTYNTRIYIAASPNVTDDFVADFEGELTFEVVEDTGDTYKLTGLMKPLSGTVNVPGPFGLRLTRLSSYSSNLEMQKANLSIIKHDYTIKGILLLTLGPIPLPLPIQMQAHRSTEFVPMWEVLPFPLFDGKTGFYQNYSMIEEFDFSAFWGLIPIDSGIVDQGWVGNCPYNCTADNITVEAGTFDVLFVSATVEFGDEGFDYYYSLYAEEVGNLAKGTYNIDYYNGNTYFLIELELKSTNYIT